MEGWNIESELEGMDGLFGIHDGGAGSFMPLCWGGDGCFYYLLLLHPLSTFTSK